MDGGGPVEAIEVGVWGAHQRREPKRKTPTAGAGAQNLILYLSFAERLHGVKCWRRVCKVHQHCVAALATTALAKLDSL